MIFIYLSLIILFYLFIKEPLIRLKLFWLILIFLIISIFFFLIHNDFLSLSYLIIYIGAISVLFLFILKLSQNSLKSINSSYTPLLLVFFFLFILLLITNYNSIYLFFYHDYSSFIFQLSNLQSFGLLLYFYLPYLIILIGIKLLIVLYGIYFII